MSETKLLTAYVELKANRDPLDRDISKLYDDLKRKPPLDLKVAVDLAPLANGKLGPTSISQDLIEASRQFRAETETMFDNMVSNMKSTAAAKAKAEVGEAVHELDHLTGAALKAGEAIVGVTSVFDVFAGARSITSLSTATAMFSKLAFTPIGLLGTSVAALAGATYAANRAGESYSETLARILGLTRELEQSRAFEQFQDRFASRSGELREERLDEGRVPLSPRGRRALERQKGFGELVPGLEQEIEKQQQKVDALVNALASTEPKGDMMAGLAAGLRGSPAAQRASADIMRKKLAEEQERLSSLEEERRQLQGDADKEGATALQEDRLQRRRQEKNMRNLFGWVFEAETGIPASAAERAKVLDKRDRDLASTQRENARAAETELRGARQRRRRVGRDQFRNAMNTDPGGLGLEGVAGAAFGGNMFGGVIAAMAMEQIQRGHLRPPSESHGMFGTFDTKGYGQALQGSIDQQAIRLHQQELQEQQQANKKLDLLHNDLQQIVRGKMIGHFA